jgi:hypothetical protein
VYTGYFEQVWWPGGAVAWDRVGIDGGVIGVSLDSRGRGGDDDLDGWFLNRSGGAGGTVNGGGEGIEMGLRQSEPGPAVWEGTGGERACRGDGGRIVIRGENRAATKKEGSARYASMHGGWGGKPPRSVRLSLVTVRVH